MIAVQTDRLVDDYLRRLEAAAAELPQERRSELVAEIREHIDHALREIAEDDEVAIRNILERLGSPEEIAEEAAGPQAAVGIGHEGGQAGRLEVAALIALVVPFIGWLVGLVLVVLSRAWSTREKLAGFVLGFLPFVVPFLVLVATGAESGTPVPVVTPEEPPADSGLGPIELAVLVFGLLAGVPPALYLGSRLGRRPSA
jgi:uncharacterized membrane protein